MDQEMQQYFDEMYEMFGTKGWKSLVTEAQEAIEQRKEQLVMAKSLDEMRYIQGEIAQLRNIESLETVVALRERGLKAEEGIETVE